MRTEFKTDASYIKEWLDVRRERKHNMNRWKLSFIVALKNITEVTVAILGVCENTYPTRLWLHALLAVLMKQQLAHSLEVTQLTQPEPQGRRAEGNTHIHTFTLPESQCNTHRQKCPNRLRTDTSERLYTAVHLWINHQVSLTSADRSTIACTVLGSNELHVTLLGNLIIKWTLL